MKKLFCLVTVLLSLALLPVFTYAHPGRTDANGGHYDSSTGEYHYHHGYEAHYHYDMDGDGIIDCPFLFDDKTGLNSGSSSRSGSGNSRDYSHDVLPAATATPEKHWYDGFQIDSAEIAIYSSICAAVLLWLIIRTIIRRRKERQDYFSNYGGKPLLTLVECPSGSCIGKDGLPKEEAAADWGSLYTFYITPKGSSYHKTYNCSKATTPINAYTLRTATYKPCKRCRPTRPDVSWVTEYKRIEALRKKYEPDFVEPSAQAITSQDE